ncbi:MAG: AI-2E family transporter [Clostridia bacterium]|nr:AI-2E family transporter [Clostridia bacterium]
MEKQPEDRRKIKIPYIQLIPISFIIMLMYKLLDKIGDVTSFIAFFVLVLKPVIIGLVLAYLMDPLMAWIETHTRLKRGLSIAVLYLGFVGILSVLIAFILPAIISSISDIVIHFPSYIEQTNAYGNELIAKFEATYGGDIATVMSSDTFTQFTTKFGQIMNGLLASTLTGIASFSSGIFNFIMGLIISIYVLKDKEKFGRGMRRLIFASFKEKQAKGLMVFIAEVDTVFSKYISGKLLDSSIIAVLAFIGLWIIGAPYKMLLAIIIGVTNMIPYFGPFIGGTPAVLITLFYSPVTALWVLIFIVVLQQFDGNILGPKILGDSVGIGPFWIILAIVIGGGLFGILGMLVGVPVIVVILNVINRQLDRSLMHKGLISMVDEKKI